MRQLRKLHLLLAILATTLAVEPSLADMGGQAQSAARKRLTCDLQVSQSVSADPVATGFAFEFYVIVLNLGANATDAVIRDSIPGNTAFQYAFSTRGSVVDSSGTLVCSLGTLAPGDSAVVALGLIPFAAGTVTNTASGATTILDANYANNVSTRSVTVQDLQGADVYLNLRHSPDSPIAGEPVTYAFNIGNAGPLAAADVTVGPQIFGVPFTVLSAIPSRGTCSGDSGSLTCSLGTIAPGDSVGVSVVVVPRASGYLYAYPYVSSPTPDPIYWNNNAYDQVFVQPSSQLLIADLISQVQSYQLRKGTEQNLVSPLQSAAAALTARDTSTACSALGDFVRRVSVFAGRGLTVDQAFQLDSVAGYIESQLQCGAPRNAMANIARLGTAAVEFSLRPVSRPGDNAPRLRLGLPAAGRVRLDVFDVGGRRIRTAFEGELPAGVHMMDWDGRGDGAGPAAPGVYFLRATMGGQGAVARVVLLR